MDVTPDEARAVEFKDGFRGYNRDQVDDFLDRVAGTIEAFEHEVSRLRQVIGERDVEAAKSKEEEATLQRALLVAQRAADETLAQAEAAAHERLADAERQALEIVDTERRRTAAEMRDLARARDALAGDVEALEAFESTYRGHLRSLIESDLAALERRPRVALDPPAMHEIAVPTEDELAASAAADERAARGARLGAAGEDLSSNVPRGDEFSVPDFGTPLAGESLTAPAAPDSPGTREIVVTDAAPLPADSLSDDQFLMALRDAARDQGPLGPGVEGDEGAQLFDQDEASAS